MTPPTEGQVLDLILHFRGVHYRIEVARGWQVDALLWKSLVIAISVLFHFNLQLWNCHEYLKSKLTNEYMFHWIMFKPVNCVTLNLTVCLCKNNGYVYSFLNNLRTSDELCWVCCVEDVRDCLGWVVCVLWWQVVIVAPSHANLMQIRLQVRLPCRSA